MSKKLKYFYFLIVLGGAINFLNSQNKNIPNYLKKAEYYYEYKRNADSIVFYANKATELSIKNNSKPFLGKSYWHIARGFLLNNHLDSSKVYIDKALIFSQKNKDIELESISKLLLARYYEKKNDLIKATELSIEVIKTADENKNYGLLAQAYYKLASTYALHDDNEKYKAYLDKAYRLMKEEDINIPISVKSGIYTYLVDYFEQKRYENPENLNHIDSLLFYADEGIAYTKSIKKSSSLVYLLGMKGKMYFLQDKFDEAHAIYNEALSYRNDLNKFHLRGLYVKLAYVHLSRNNIKKALLYKDSILQDIFEEPSYYRKAERYNVAYDISKTAQKYDIALEYHEKMSENLNKAKDEKQIKALNELEIKYETEKKDAEIVKQKLENETIKNKARTNYFLLGLAGIIGFSVLSLLYLKKKNKALSTELDLANTKAKLHRSQINPHFISNSINAIYPFLYNKSDPNKAAAYLSDLSQMIRSILDSTFETTWTIKEELIFIKQYCKIQELKMDYPLKLNIDFDDSIENTIIPSLLMQPFVENSFVHGFSESQKNAEISIKITKQESFVLIQIIDNGEAESILTKNHTSRSTNITKQRIYTAYKKVLLPKYFLNYGKLPNNGYQVTIKLPDTQ
ncbi:MAG: histidine kinase [Flavobacteriaceae bacterium]